MLALACMVAHLGSPVDAASQPRTLNAATPEWRPRRGETMTLDLPSCRTAAAPRPCCAFRSSTGPAETVPCGFSAGEISVRCAQRQAGRLASCLRADRGLPGAVGLSARALPMAGRAGDGERQPYSPALLREPPEVKPGRDRPRGAVAGLRCAAWAPIGRATPCFSCY